MQLTESRSKPRISPHLLWEYNLETFDFDRSAFVVIERVIERGTLGDWREMVRYYGNDRILETAEKSKQLNAKDKSVVNKLIKSAFIKDVA